MWKNIIKCGGDCWLNVDSCGGGGRLNLLNFVLCCWWWWWLWWRDKIIKCWWWWQRWKIVIVADIKNLSALKASSLFCMSSVSPGFGAFLTSLLVMSFLPISSSLSKEPTTGFCASNVEMSWKTSWRGFSLQKIFFDIGFRFCLRLALLSLWRVTQRLISAYIRLTKLLVAK